MRVVIPFILLLAACGKQAAQPSKEAEAPASAAEPAAPAAKAFALEEQTDLYEISYSYPAEAAAIPQLVQFFTTDIAKIRAELTKSAQSDYALRKKDGFDFNPYNSSTAYELAGQSPALLSLRKEHGEFTGGAHPNSYTGAILWDRAANREIKPSDLFADPSNMERLLTQRWCDALNKAREERRGEPVGEGGMFDECPKLSEIAVIPTDKNRNGRFDTLALVASPYVAGPYAEGGYDLELAITAEVTGALKDAVRASFEVQPQ